MLLERVGASHYYPRPPEAHLHLKAVSGILHAADVLDDPNQMFLIQNDGTSAATDYGKNADIVIGTGSTTTGVSANELDTSSIATTAALNLKVIGLWDVPNNAVGANAVVVVKINEHLYGSAGVAGQ